NLKIVHENLSDPAADEVTVQVKAIGLNFADIFAIWGLYSATPEGFFIPGLEYAGVIEKVGKNVTNVKVGDRVMGITRFGAYTTHLNIDSRYVIPLPADWDFSIGAAYLVQVLTAYYAMVKLGDMQKNYTVLIHSAAGGVGILANRIAKKFAAFTIGTTGSPKKVDFIQNELGYDAAIVRGKDFRQQLQNALDGRELDLVMECIGGEVLKIGYEELAPMRRMVVYGSARYATPVDRPNPFKLIYKFLTRPKIDPQMMIEENKGVLGFNLIHLYERSHIMHEMLQEISQLDIGKPYVGHEFSFSALPDAIRLFASGKTVGKVVIKVD
ncbi:MAG: zinc-binding dehydrogenase, partial [Saprospiraceae bacterium]